MTKQLLPKEKLRDWRKKKVADGWKYYSILLPAEVLTPLLQYKDHLMESYRERKLIMENTPDIN